MWLSLWRKKFQNSSLWPIVANRMSASVYEGHDVKTILEVSEADPQKNKKQTKNLQKSSQFVKKSVQKIQEDMSSRTEYIPLCE